MSEIRQPDDRLETHLAERSAALGHRVEVGDSPGACAWCHWPVERVLAYSVALRDRVVLACGPRHATLLAAADGDPVQQRFAEAMGWIEAAVTR